MLPQPTASCRLSRADCRPQIDGERLRPLATGRTLLTAHLGAPLCARACVHLCVCVLFVCMCVVCVCVVTGWSTDLGWVGGFACVRACTCVCRHPAAVAPT